MLNVPRIGGIGVPIYFSISGFLVSQSRDADPDPCRCLPRLERTPTGGDVPIMPVFQYAAAD